MAYQGRKQIFVQNDLSINQSECQKAGYYVVVPCKNLVRIDIAVSNKTKMTRVFLRVVVYRRIRTEMYQPRKPCEGLLEFFGIGLFRVFDATS